MTRRATKRVLGGRKVTSKKTLSDQSGVKRAFNCQEGEVEDGAQCLHLVPISHHERVRRVRESAGQSGEWLTERRETDIREFAFEPEWR